MVPLLVRQPFPGRTQDHQMSLPRSESPELPSSIPRPKPCTSSAIPRRTALTSHVFPPSTSRAALNDREVPLKSRRRFPERVTAAQAASYRSALYGKISGPPSHYTMATSTSDLLLMATRAPGTDGSSPITPPLSLRK